MATIAAPLPSPGPAPLIRPNALITARGTAGGGAVGYLIAVGASFLFHALLFLVLFFLVSAPTAANPATEITAAQEKEAVVHPEEPTDPDEPEKKKEITSTKDVDDALPDPAADINNDSEREAKVSTPGIVNPDLPVGVEGAKQPVPPTPLPSPGGFGIGQGGALEVPGLVGNVDLPGMEGGGTLQGAALPGTIFGRGSGATREKALIDGGGTEKTEAAVAKGLHWLIRHQHLDGAWRLRGPFPSAADGENEIAGTAFGLLPFLAAGKTHLAAKDNPFDKPVEKALFFLMRRQDRRTGDFGGGMYGHALATIAICEAYGLTKDLRLRASAQGAVDFLVAAQHVGGGWRYSPNQAGDTSVTGWVVMGLKSAKMADLNVPENTFQKAIRYLDSCRDPKTDGYGYVGRGSSPAMSAVGLLCRQYLQSWGPSNPKMVKGIETQLKALLPGKTRHIYYYYYATQVMHHFGGEEWDAWNAVMREDLVKRQDPDGSWDPRGADKRWESGDPHGKAGGRLMETSLSLLTLEVYYRYLPLFQRNDGEKHQRLLMGS